MENENIKTTVGTVVSDKMDKSVIVAVDRIKAHRLYKKKYTVTKRYNAHDAENQYKVGDVVLIASSKPLSKNKKHTVVKKIG
ncbi:MAG: 30S ribosomal protein S17 [Patescibacteria group bacterium]